MTFAEKLAELRRRKGLAEEDLAHAAGVRYATYRTYAGGRRVPSFPTVVALAKALGVAVSVFAECEFPRIKQKQPRRV
jgi:transcriptional regulator with XRE-family HTH domain